MPSAVTGEADAFSNDISEGSLIVSIEPVSITNGIEN